MPGDAAKRGEIIIRAVPAPSHFEVAAERSARRGADEAAGQIYDALLYTNLELPTLAPLDAGAVPTNQPGAVVGLPLRHAERFSVRWGTYRQYWDAFVTGEKEPTHMRDRLWEILPPKLAAFFSGPPPMTEGDRRIRLWWSSDALELVELPWELIATGPDSPAGWFTLVRGLPPGNPVPQVPLAGSPRLALIDSGGVVPATLRDRLREVPGIDLIERRDHPLALLREAAAEGYELVHLIADGYPTLAFDAVLYVHGADPPELPVSELSAVLRGSRVVALGLTAYDALSPNTAPLGGRDVPSVYRAFACLGGSHLPLPSVIAPLGPTEPERTEAFWDAFYRALGETLNLETALDQARAATPAYAPKTAAPMALFLRHRSGHPFRRVAEEASGAGAAAPTQLFAELELSRTLVSRLNAVLNEETEAPPNLVDFMASETLHQERLEADLEPWRTLEVGEE